MSKGARKVITKFVKVAQPKTVASTVARLTKKVNAIAKVEKDHVCRVMYQQNDILNLATVAGAQPSQIIPLTNYTYWARCFGTDADDEQAKKAVIRKASFQYFVDSSSELDLVGYTIFCVSLKKNASALLDATGFLPAALTSGTHFVGTGSKVLLNLNYFNVHAVKRHMTGDTASSRGSGTTTAPTIPNTPSGSDLRFRGQINMNYNKGNGLAVQNPKGDWRACNYPQDDTQNYFVLVFSDDSTLDGSISKINYTAIHSVDVVG